MNKKFMEPEMEISAFEVEDIVTASGDGNSLSNEKMNVFSMGIELPLVSIDLDK